MTAIALIMTDMDRSAFGLPARLGDRLGDATVLAHTVRRAARVRGVERLVIVHPPGQAPMTLLDGASVGKPVDAFEAAPIGDVRHLVAGRKWALHAWRGGLGGACVYDELLPAGPLVAAMEAHDADAAVLVRGDWCLFDPDYAAATLAMHLEHPEAFKLTFTQAPPGLAGIVTSRTVLRQFAEHGASFGQVLAYNPRKPHPDAIGRDVCHPIPSQVRDTYERFVYDTPRAVARVRQIAAALGDRLNEASAEAIAAAARAAEPEVMLPQQVTLELTPRRPVAGPITPQGYVAFDRPDLDLDLAGRLLTQLAEPGDVALTLGGLGDALLHPQWDQIVTAAHDAGVLGIHVETDLHCDGATLDRLLSLPIDVISVRLNADRAETYRKLMGADAFGAVVEKLQSLFDRRRVSLRGQLPWIVPRLIKTAETLKDMESFFDRWMMIAQHAVIEPARCGCGLMPEQSPVPMAPPKRRPCRQLGQRMTILSNGQVALCDQDWQGRGAMGDATIDTLTNIWQRFREPVKTHAEGRYDDLALCAACTEWHRP